MSEPSSGMDRVKGVLQWHQCCRSLPCHHCESKPETPADSCHFWYKIKQGIVYIIHILQILILSILFSCLISFHLIFTMYNLKNIQEYINKPFWSFNQIRGFRHWLIREVIGASWNCVRSLTVAFLLPISMDAHLKENQSLGNWHNLWLLIHNQSNLILYAVPVKICICFTWIITP